MATKKTVEHSKHFAKVKKYYDKDLWSKARVYKAVECKWITADEYKEITGEISIHAPRAGCDWNDARRW